jgi:TRAP-type transport system periplasmic protein
LARHAFTFAGYKGEQSIHGAAAQHFCNSLRATLGDAGICTVLPDTTTRSPEFADIAQVVADGALDFCYLSTVRLVKFVPEFTLFDLPFLSEDRAEIFGLLDGVLGDFFKTEMKRKSPFRILAFWDNGLRHITNRLRPIKALSDCKGITMRTQLSETIGDTVRAMGFTAQPMDIRQFRKQLDGPDIQAQENDLPTTYNFGFHNHHPYITMTGHILGVRAVFCLNEAFMSWPDHVQTGVQTAMDAAAKFQQSLSVDLETETAAKLEAEGATLTRLGAEAKAEFHNAVAPVFEKHSGIFKDQVFKQFF